VILGLVFVLGVLIGMWMTSGGRRKWKARHNEELEKRRVLERDLKDREAHWSSREKEWRERDSLSAAATRRDRDRDGPLDRGPEDRPIVGRHPDDDRRF
jgi:hypothetical protein